MKHLYEINFICNFIEHADLIKLDRLIEHMNIKEGMFELQDFIGEHLKKECEWMTSMGIIDATKIIVDDAIANGNIAPK